MQISVTKVNHKIFRRSFYNKPGMHTGNGLRPLLMLSVDWHVGSPVFLTGLSSAHTFNTGSFGTSSYTQISTPPQHISGRKAPYSNGDQQRRALDLLHVRDGARVVRLERAHDLEGRRQDAHDAIGAAQKEV